MTDHTRRNQLKREYKESHRPAGVFEIRNLDNGKVLLGVSRNLPGALNKARFQLGMGSHLNRELQADWQRLGEDKFAIAVLEELEPPEGPEWDPGPDLEALEELWLEKLGPYDQRGYHRRPRSSSK